MAELGLGAKPEEKELGALTVAGVNSARRQEEAQGARKEWSGRQLGRHRPTGKVKCTHDIPVDVLGTSI